jgi:hypothetical protein
MIVLSDAYKPGWHYRMDEKTFRAEVVAALCRRSGKTCQNRSVSSPAPVTMVLPSGESAWKEREA